VRKIIFRIADRLDFLSPAARADSDLAWAEHVQEVKLANGLRFLLYPRGEAPIFTAYIAFAPAA
jgi:hypothetical protein